MTVTERPLYGRLELERWNDPSIKHPAQVIYSNDTGDTTGWTTSFISNGSGVTSAIVTSDSQGPTGTWLVVLTNNGTTHVNPTPSVVASRTITGLVVGASYSFSADVGTVFPDALQARITFGGVSTPVVSDGPQKVTGTWVATSTSTTLTLNVEDKPSSASAYSAAIGYFDNITVTRAKWVEPFPGNWVPYIADATSCSIRRGGSRSGLGIKTDVGTMSFTLHNAEDPLNGGAFKSGQTVRAVSAVPVSTKVVDFAWLGTPSASASTRTTPTGVSKNLAYNGFVRTDSAGWALTGTPTAAVTRVPIASAPPRTWSDTTHLMQYAPVAGTGTPRAYIGTPTTTTRIEVVPGQPHNVKALVSANFEAYWTATIYYYDAAGTYISGLTIAPAAYTTANYWATVSVNFSAAPANAARSVVVIGPKDSRTYVSGDKFWVGCLTVEAGPSPSATVWDGNTSPTWTDVPAMTPIFTGTVSDIKATYPLDKATGKKRTSVTVEVADAVKVHGTTPRYGAMIGAPYYETFEQRITRLAGSALAPIEPPGIGAPREVYSF